MFPRPRHSLLLACFAGGAALFFAGCAHAPPVPQRQPATAVAEPHTAGVQDLSGRLAAVIQQHNIPGMVALVLRGDRIVAEGAAGVRKRGADAAVTLDDRFAIASAAKAMSATVAARLIEQNKLSWDTSVADLFPHALPAVDPAWRHVTVRQLIEHQAGLKDHLFQFARTMLWRDGNESSQRRAYALKVLARPPDFAPGTRFLYNNTDYLILGAALERLTGRTWSELIGSELFRPLEMTSAGLGPPGTPGQLDQPWGHGGKRIWNIPMFGGNTPFDPGSSQADYPLAAAPSGFVHVTIRDWAEFVTLHLRGHAANPHRAAALLQAETFVALHEPEKSGGAYAGGWFTGVRPWAKGPRPEDRGRILFHGGNNGRWTSVVYIAPEIDFAALVACNRGGMWPGIDQVASMLVGAFAGTPRMDPAPSPVEATR